MERSRILNPIVSIFILGLGTQLCALPGPGTTTIKGVVWVDADANGLRDPGEAGRSGVAVDLVTAANSKIAASTSSDDSGAFAFEGVQKLAYRVAFTLPEGYTFSPQDQGLDDGLDSDVNPGGSFPGQTESFVPGDSTLVAWDAGLVPSPALPPSPPATAEPAPATPLPTPEPVTQAAGDYRVQYIVAIDTGENAALVNLPPIGTLHVSQDGDHLTMEIEGADPDQTRITFDTTLEGVGTATAFASSRVAGIPDVSTQIAGGFLRPERGDIQVSFTLEIGVNGELPGGQEVVYSVVSE